MSFVWSDYLDLAKELLGSAVGSPIEEAKLRSAISRAYYAAFNEARNYLVLNKPGLIIPDTGEAHEIVTNAFLNDTNSDWVTIGNSLNRLKINRRVVDYRNPVNGLPNLTAISMRYADTAIAKLKTL